MSNGEESENTSIKRAKKKKTWPKWGNQRGIDRKESITESEKT